VARDATSEITERIRRTVESYLSLQADYRAGKYPMIRT
jgi:hypothetical protein